MQLDFAFHLPKWCKEQFTHIQGNYPAKEDRIRFAIALSRENVERGTGGPFGAAVFHSDGTLIAPGLNLVETENCSILHAEMVAIALAQQTLGRYDISDGGKTSYELVSSCEPCAMCFGSVPWSGLKKLICAARDEDARRIGFDEGPKLPDWQGALEQRGIEVFRDVMREQAVDVLNSYAKTGGTIYSSPSPEPQKHSE